jgi:hypothetical protein
MGSLNWNGQAVKYNQETIFFYEDNNNTNQYGAEFEKKWNSFSAEID